MNGLTKRERILIIVGLSFVVLFLAYTYLISPAVDNYNEKTELYAQLQFDRDSTVNKIASEQNVMTIYDNTLASYNELKQLYPEEMSNQDLDNLITGICLKYNLRPTSLGISGNRDDTETDIINATIKVSVNTNYYDLQRFINTINNTTYIQISMLNYSVNGETLDIDMDINVQMLKA